jgi:hypothetical protein
MVWMFRMSGERYLPACVVPTVKFGGGGITLWGSFSWNGLGPLVILHGNLNAEVYKNILTRCTLSTVEDQFGDDDCLYHHDNAPCHEARPVKEWSVGNYILEMDLLARSPDLNPIEHPRDELERRIRSRTQSPTSLTALVTAVQEEWAAIPPETFRHLVESLPGRVRAVILVKWWAHTVLYPRLGSVSQRKSDYSFEWVSGYFWSESLYSVYRT